MYSNYKYPVNNQYLYQPYQTPYTNPNSNGNNEDDRFIAAGGFLAPFLLGGLAGAAIAPNIGWNRPNYYNTNYYPYPPTSYNYYNPYYSYYYRR